MTLIHAPFIQPNMAKAMILKSGLSPLNSSFHNMMHLIKADP